MKKISIVLLALLLMTSLGACSKNKEEEEIVVTTTQAFNADDYRIAMPFQASDSRQTHIEFNNGRIVNIDTVGEGLLRYSKEYFNPQTYYLQEGQLLDRDTLQVYTTAIDTEGILGFKSATNPYGLNPEDGSSIPIDGNTTIKSSTGKYKTIPIIDVFEVDYMKSNKKDADIEGIGLTIVMTPTIVDKKGKEHTMEEKQMTNLGEEAARNLVAYLRSLPQVKNNTPILVTLFREDSDQSSLPGRFFAIGYGKNNIDKFKKIDESWVIIPSDEAIALDTSTVTQFTSIKKALFEFLPNNISIIGKGLYVDKKLSKLRMTITCQTRTYTEEVAVVQYVRELLSSFNDKDYTITVKFNADGETFAMIERESGSSDSTVIMY